MSAKQPNIAASTIRPSFIVENAFAKVYVCLQKNCPLVTSSYSELTEHMQNCHSAVNINNNKDNRSNVFRCFAQPSLEVGNILYICSMCGCKEEYESDLCSHIMKEHNVAPIYTAEVVSLARKGIHVPVFNMLDTDVVVLAKVFNSAKESHSCVKIRCVVGVPAILRSLTRQEQLFMVKRAAVETASTKTPVDHKTFVVSEYKETEAEPNFYLRVEDETLVRDCPTETDTLLTGPDFLEIDERHKVFSIAPGEGMTPLSIFSDECAEEKAFPEIWLGQKRVTNADRYRYITYGQQCKCEIRNSDRRVAKNIDNLFFKVKKLQMKILLSNPSIAVRKFEPGKTKLTAREVKNTSFVEKLVRRDEGYAFLKNLRGSPPYFEQAKKDLFAMIRQLGAATFFCSFSSAETKWKHLLRILGKVNDNIEYSDAEIEAMTWETVCRLIRSDPVTCARHFDYQMRHFIYGFLMSSVAPIGVIQDWFYRVEMQNRGSCHAHFIIWIVDAPKYGSAKEEEITEFIDRYITCRKPQHDDPLRELVDRQVHKHSKACQTRKGFCRFHYPQPPMLKTSILKPLANDSPDIASARKTWRLIYKYLNDLKLENAVTFAEMLETFSLTYDDYILAIRSSIKAETIFLQRDVSEIRVNNYNEACIRGWRANMDIQYITDIYQCAMYVVSYISKAHRGISELLANAVKEAKEGNFTLKETFRHISNCFTNGVEISAQEAVYILLGMPLRQSSRQVVFINTSPPEERVRLLKPMHEIQQLDDDDEDIVQSNLIVRYAKRPRSLDDLCLADWVAFYEGCKIKAFEKPLSKNLAADGFPAERMEPEENEDVPLEEELTKASRNNPSRRKVPRIIRPVWFNYKTEKEKCYRELLMLFLPWRDEEKDLKHTFGSFEEHYRQVKHIVDAKLTIYSPHHAIFQDVLDNLSNMSLDEDLLFQFAPNEQQHNIDEQEHLHRIGTYADPPEQYDIGTDMGITVNLVREDELVRNREESDEAFRKMVQSLNDEQKDIFHHILNVVKTGKPQQCIFVTGGAGVGKTFFIHTLYQALIKFYDHQPGANFSTMKVLLTAPTGKAAYNIRGNTIHSTLALSGRGGPHVKGLTIDMLSRLRNKLGDIKFLIIDEISMVGSKMLNMIDERLKQLQRSNLPFGGIHVLAVGDLYQLQPVCDPWIFENADSMYNVLTRNKWRENFRMFELTTMMRQKGDIPFARLLNRLRVGIHTNADIDTLNSRLLRTTDKHYSLNIPHAFFMNAPKNAFNMEALDHMDGRLHSLVADDTVIGGHPRQLVDKVLSNIPDDTRRTMRLHKVLHTKVGHKAEVVLNIDTEDGLVNGAPCDIMSIEYSASTPPKPRIVWVKFDDERTGKQTRQNNARLYSANTDTTWTPILPVIKRFSAPNNKTLEVQRRQFPLSPAHGRTIHRLQGGTLNELVCSIVGTNSAKPPAHIHYVAFSRVTELQKLHILSYDPAEIRIDERVTVEMSRLRTHGRLNVTGNPFNTKAPSQLGVVYLNCTSLHKHIKDVRADSRFCKADLCFLTETRVRLVDPYESYKLLHFHEFVFEGSTTSPGKRSHYGTIVYAKKKFEKGFPQMHTTRGVEVAEVRLEGKPSTLFLSVYRSPSSPLVELLQILTSILERQDDSTTILILGDFNSDLANDKPQNKLKEILCDKFKLIQLVREPTTDSLTSIDHIYASSAKPLPQTGIFENCFSFHKAIWAII